MKKTFSIEIKILIAATVAVLALATAVVLRQVFGDNDQKVEFVYNSTVTTLQDDVNISEIFGENVQ